MYEQYKPRHPLAWGIMAGIALFSAVAVGAKQGWLPVGDSRLAAQACAECAVVESIRTVESPPMPLAPELTAAESPAVPADEAAEPEQVAGLIYSYETTVRFEDGRTSVFSHAKQPAWKAGDKVRVVDGEILVQG